MNFCQNFNHLHFTLSNICLYFVRDIIITNLVENSFTQTMNSRYFLSSNFKYYFLFYIYLFNKRYTTTCTKLKTKLNRSKDNLTET